MVPCFTLALLICPLVKRHWRLRLWGKKPKGRFFSSSPWFHTSTGTKERARLGQPRMVGWSCPGWSRYKGRDIGKLRMGIRSQVRERRQGNWREGVRRGWVGAEAGVPYWIHIEITSVVIPQCPRNQEISSSGGFRPQGTVRACAKERQSFVFMASFLTIVQVNVDRWRMNRRRMIYSLSPTQKQLWPFAKIHSI